MTIAFLAIDCRGINPTGLDKFPTKVDSAEERVSEFVSL